MTDDLIKRLKMWVDTCDSNDLLEGACPDISLAADALEALQEQVTLLTANTSWWSKPWAPVPLDTLNELLAERLKRQQVEHERDSILEDLADAEKDAKRYRWLRDTNDLDWFVNGKVVHDFGPMPEGAKEGFFGVTTFIGRQRGESLDMAIDAAIAQEPKP